MKAIHLKTEHMANPIGIDVPQPVLSWNCSEGIRQTAYEVIATQDGEAVWHTGKVPSSPPRISQNTDRTHSASGSHR